MARHLRTDWPLPESEEFQVFFQGWVRAFDLRRVRFDEADAASERLMRRPPPYLGDHLAWILDAVDEERCVMQNFNPPPPKPPPLPAEEEARVREIVSRPGWWRLLAGPGSDEKPAAGHVAKQYPQPAGSPSPSTPDSTPGRPGR